MLDIGVDAQSIAAQRAAEAAARPAREQAASNADVCEIWHWHRDALRAFQACRTQWRVVGAFNSLIYIGLDYGAVRLRVRNMGLQTPWAELIEQLGMMEIGALSYLNRAD